MIDQLAELIGRHKCQSDLEQTDNNMLEVYFAQDSPSGVRRHAK